MSIYHMLQLLEFLEQFGVPIDGASASRHDRTQ
jgi:hypothetical protein